MDTYNKFSHQNSTFVQFGLLRDVDGFAPIVAAKAHKCVNQA